METSNSNDQKSPSRWPNGARAAVSVTLDNMGEAADLNRKLWPECKPVGKHYTVTEVIPKILKLLKKYDVLATYFIESWNINIYGDFILNQVVAEGHEMAWHAWQHEAWSKLKDQEERANFERSFGPQGIGQWLAAKRIEPYCGLRPPGGIINYDRTLKLCREFGLDYISPAGEQAATVEVGREGDRIIILPFRWATVDAYYYMETFAGLRKLKGEYPSDPQPPEVLTQRYILEIDKAIENEDFLAILFHPFLTDRPERLEAVESVLKYLAQKRDEGKIWLARCRDVQQFVSENPSSVGTNPRWDLSSWR
ncbi:carbohydrate esterase family 4 protein [Glonium stellatum]|uniref:chitin deacetylase n=1 Tax=Glonium stellatum TaxID=574774 RepID=A0A8E2EPE8_9PEZI|nr:carbohydrate esterase family 4 protein [Glonium stellatum]